jgi:hypothetical protein
MLGLPEAMWDKQGKQEQEAIPQITGRWKNFAEQKGHTKPTSNHIRKCSQETNIFQESTKIIPH